MKRAEPYQCALANERAVHVDEVGLIHEQAADVPRALHDRDCRAALLPRCARLNGAERRFPIAPAQQQRPTHEVVLIGGRPTLAPHGAACDEYLDEGGLRLGVLLRGREGLLDCELDGGWQCRRRVRGVRMATGDLAAGIVTEVAQARRPLGPRRLLRLTRPRPREGKIRAPVLALGAQQCGHEGLHDDEVLERRAAEAVQLERVVLLEARCSALLTGSCKVGGCSGHR